MSHPNFSENSTIPPSPKDISDLLPWVFVAALLFLIIILCIILIRNMKRKTRSSNDSCSGDRPASLATTNKRNAREECSDPEEEYELCAGNNKSYDYPNLTENEIKKLRESCKKQVR